MAKVIQHPAKPMHPPGSIPVGNRAYPGAGQLLSARLEDWARALPPWRVEQGLFMFDILDAFGGPEKRLLEVMEATGWWLYCPPSHDNLRRPFPRYFPPWIIPASNIEPSSWFDE